MHASKEQKEITYFKSSDTYLYSLFVLLRYACVDYICMLQKNKMYVYTTHTYLKRTYTLLQKKEYM